MVGASPPDPEAACPDGAHLSIKSTLPGLQTQWEQFVKKCKDAGLSDAAIAAFKHNYDQLVAGATGLASSLLSKASWI
jgi:hypothetical protein